MQIFNWTTSDNVKQIPYLESQKREMELNDNSAFITPVLPLSDHVAQEGQQLVTDIIQSVRKRYN